MRGDTPPTNPAPGDTPDPGAPNLTGYARRVAPHCLLGLFILAVAHTVEMVVFFKLCREAGGSLPLHLLNIFLFGIFHAKEIKEAQQA